MPIIFNTSIKQFKTTVTQNYIHHLTTEHIDVRTGHCQAQDQFSAEEIRLVLVPRKESHDPKDPNCKNAITGWVRASANYFHSTIFIFRVHYFS